LIKYFLNNLIFMSTYLQIIVIKYYFFNFIIDIDNKILKKKYE